MIKFYNRTIRVNEMGGKYFVEIKDKAFDFSSERDSPPSIEDSNVKQFDTAEEATKYINSVVP